ncbi:MAG TPA: hypothetical protein VER33_15915 [Polyangiaceae bacterium]|nr:hypothetical protein [Polyangiaceae bacterium]
MFPVVVIDVLPPSELHEHAAQMVEACSRALPSGDCALSTAVPESTRPASVAMVLWQGSDFLQASVRVSQRDRQWTTRNLTFAEDDPLQDRWTTVGLTVATLVDELSPPAPQERVEPDQTAVKPPPAAVAAQPTPVAEPPPRARRELELALGLGLVVGPAWQGGEWQRGALSTVAAGLSGVPFVVLVTFSYSVSNGPDFAEGGPVRTRWYSGSVGLGVRAPVRVLDSELLGALELSGRRANAELGNTTGADDELRARARGQWTWPDRGRFGALLGGTASIPAAGEVSSERQAVRSSSFVAEVFGGLELRL